MTIPSTSDLLALAQYQQMANQQNQYAQQSMSGLGAYFGVGVGAPIPCPPPERQKKLPKRGYIARLRDEIEEWHGDILAA